MEHMGELIVVTGPPGAGKSAVCRALSRMFEPSALVAGDAFFGFIRRGYVPPWTIEACRQNEIVVRAAAAAAGRLAAGGYTVVYDGVVTPSFVDAFTFAAGLTAVNYVVLLPPEETCVERVRSRARHGFTDINATRRMHQEFAGAVGDHLYLIATAEGPDLIAARIVRLVADKVVRWETDGH